VAFDAKKSAVLGLTLAQENLGEIHLRPGARQIVPDTVPLLTFAEDELS